MYSIKACRPSGAQATGLHRVTCGGHISLGSILVHVRMPPLWNLYRNPGVKYRVAERVTKGYAGCLSGGYAMPRTALCVVCVHSYKW